MKKRSFAIVGLAAVMALPAAAQSTGKGADGLVVTPPGITLQPLDKGQGYDLGKSAASFIARERIAFTDAKGMTLYTYAPDPKGKSTCVAACAEEWKPMPVLAGVRAFGPWTIITRDDGAKQWAYDGKALYTFVKDVDPGSVGGNSPARFGSRRMNGAGVWVGGGLRGSTVAGVAPDVPLPAEWAPALAFPVAHVTPPDGIAVREVPDAAAFTLVDARNFTLYTTNGNPAKTEAREWTPLAAPMFAKVAGDFSFIDREDGIRQWAYKGKGLYTYSGDVIPGDANGAVVSRVWDVAAVLRYFMPETVQIVDTPGLGRVLATTKGQTLYRRDGHILQSGGGHNLRRGAPPRPAVGRDIGTDPRCMKDCDAWHPYLAPDNAQPQGFWSVALRDDGKKQWVYQGYALWTFAGDTRPGDINGNDIYDILFSTEKIPQEIDIGTAYDGTPGLRWSIAIP